jgi:hypothetical protein
MVLGDQGCHYCDPPAGAQEAQRSEKAALGHTVEWAAGSGSPH